MLRVLLISNYNIVEGRGPMYRLMNMIPYLNKKCQVEICSLGPIDREVKRMIKKENIPCYEVPYKTSGWFVKNTEEITTIIIDICKKDNIDLVVLTWEIWDIAVSIQKKINKCNSKFVVIMHSIPFVGSTIKTGNYVGDYIKKVIFEPRLMIKKYLLSRATQVHKYMHSFNIITMTKTVEYKLNKYFKNIKLYTTYPGYAVSLPKLPSMQNYNYDYVFMAKFEYGKGIFEITKIMKRLKKMNDSFRLALVGDFTFNDEKERFIKEIKKNSLENNIDMLGWLDGKKKYEVIMKSKVFLYPSFAGDTFSICLLEALSCGKQIVCYDVPFVRDNFNIKTVHKVPVFKNKAFAEKANELLKENEHYFKESVSFVNDNYSSWKNVADAEFEAYQKIMGDIGE